MLARLRLILYEEGPSGNPSAPNAANTDESKDQASAAADASCLFTLIFTHESSAAADVRMLEHPKLMLSKLHLHQFAH